MKWIAIIAVCLAVLLYIFQRPEVGLEQREDGLYYKAGAETAFTGNGVVYHSNKQKAQEGEIENGKSTGSWKIWHANGQLSWEGSYKDGKKDGVWPRYDEAGAKVAESPWKDDIEQVSPAETGQSPAATPAPPVEQKHNE